MTTQCRFWWELGSISWKFLLISTISTFSWMQVWFQMRIFYKIWLRQCRWYLEFDILHFILSYSINHVLKVWNNTSQCYKYVPGVLEERARAGNPDRGIAPINIEHAPNIVKYTPYENIYGNQCVGLIGNIQSPPLSACTKWFRWTHSDDFSPSLTLHSVLILLPT